MPDFVIKAADLPVLNYLASGYARPCGLQWIDRGTDRKLQRTAVDMLRRTMFSTHASPSVAHLHERAGLRARFETEAERYRFSQDFRAAQATRAEAAEKALCAVFRDRKAAEHAVAEIMAGGVNEEAISLLWRTGQYIEPAGLIPRGHSVLSVAGAATGGSIAGALLGVSLLLAPGIGGVAVAGAVATSAIGNMAAFGSALGATGGTMARMLTDMDVEGREDDYFRQEVTQGLVFVEIDLATAGKTRDELQAALLGAGGAIQS